MSTDDSNPYQASSIDPKPDASHGSIEYMRAIHYIFESPKWTANLLWGSLCILTTQVIPIVGHLVWIGYQFEIVERLLSSSSRAIYPDFDTNRIKDYLVRGLWIFLVSLVVALVMLPVFFILMIGFFVVMGVVGAASDGNEGAMTIGMIILMVFMGLTMFVMWFLMVLVMNPL